jgi:hypothetical protein
MSYFPRGVPAGSGAKEAELGTWRAVAAGRTMADNGSMTRFSITDVMPFRGAWHVVRRREAPSRHPHRVAALAEAERLAVGTDTIIVVRNEQGMTDQIIVYHRGRRDRDIPLSQHH